MPKLHWSITQGFNYACAQFFVLLLLQQQQQLVVRVSTF
jgi:hypothetical protein